MLRFMSIVPNGYFFLIRREYMSKSPPSLPFPAPFSNVIRRLLVTRSSHCHSRRQHHKIILMISTLSSTTMSFSSKTEPASLQCFPQSLLPLLVSLRSCQIPLERAIPTHFRLVWPSRNHTKRRRPPCGGKPNALSKR